MLEQKAFSVVFLLLLWHIFWEYGMRDLRSGAKAREADRHKRSSWFVSGIDPGFAEFRLVTLGPCLMARFNKNVFFFVFDTAIKNYSRSAVTVNCCTCCL